MYNTYKLLELRASSLRPIAAARHNQLRFVARVRVQVIAIGRRTREIETERRSAAVAAAAVVHRFVRAVAVHGRIAERAAEARRRDVAVVLVGGLDDIDGWAG